MRQLHVVALSQDGKSLLLAGTSRGKKATHRVAVDAKFRAALRASERAGSAQASDDGGRRESALTPREMQARLRAGASVAEVAKAAGVPVDRVERFFAPVESERIQILDAAQSATMERPRWGDSSRPLGDSVAANLVNVASLRPETVTWSARRRDDGCWVVRVEFVARARRRVAEWEWSPRERILAPCDTLAASLGYVEPRGRARARRTSPARKTTKRSTSRSRTRTPAKRTTKRTVKKTAKKTARKATKRTTKKTAKKTAKRTTARTSARSRSSRRR